VKDLLLGGTSRSFALSALRMTTGGLF